ncbi:MAG: GTP 3',8-cyclase MoaA [Myxococcales bacterium]|nr:GTP 3',8-cyclase MoaA [Myxococcales bacterium]
MTEEQQTPPTHLLQDAYHRTIRDLRISVTERCNYRCFYCKPEFGFLEARHRKGILSYEEITRLARIFVGMGVEKLRLTGGEPLLRRDIEDLVRMLADIDGLHDLAMTTNAHLLTSKAKKLREAGLHRLTISLDSLRPERFAQITGQDSLAQVMRGIQAAEDAGFSPLKVNAVIVRGVNDDEIVDFAQYSRDTGHIVRFIEFMPLDEDKQWTNEKVVTQAEMVEKLREVGELVEKGRSYSSETASTFSYSDGRGNIGIIAPVTAPFCGQCSRLRLTAAGKLRTCLFSLEEHDLLDLLRKDPTDDEVIERIRAITLRKEPGHKIGQTDFARPDRSMSLIGG